MSKAVVFFAPGLEECEGLLGGGYPAPRRR